jgi:hypothetical protein
VTHPWYSVVVGGTVSPTKEFIMFPASIHQALTGEATTDLGNGAYSVGQIPTEAEAFVKSYEPCENSPVHTVPTDPTVATLAEVTTYLRLVAEGTSKDAGFAGSLVAYAERTGTLTEKQAKHARRLYTKWHRACEWLARHKNGQHEWKYAGTKCHNSNYDLGTYAETSYYQCEQCGKWKSQYTNKNYSGD